MTVIKAGSLSGQPVGASVSGQTNGPSITPLTRDEAIQLALAQASAFQAAKLNESIAIADTRLAKTAFLPRFTTSSALIYNTPSSNPTSPALPRSPSFLSANAFTEYSGLITVSGDIDTSGRLRAVLERSRALLEAAHAGSEAARRTLILETDLAYYGLALASAHHQSAEQNLAGAVEFERLTKLLSGAGEVAPVDQIRARLQTTTRRGELDQALADEAVAALGLRTLVGYDSTTPIATTNLETTQPDGDELERFTSEAISRRPELAQLLAEERAVEQEARLARSDRRPQVSYSVNGGFDSDSLRPSPLGYHSGALAAISVNVPIHSAFNSDDDSSGDPLPPSASSS